MTFIKPEFYRNLIRETGVSFIHGVTTSSIKSFINNKTNLILAQVQALQKGLEHAKFTLIHNIIVYGLLKGHMKVSFANMLGFFLSSFLTGSRNGIIFGLKNGFFGFLLTFFNRIYN